MSHKDKKETQPEKKETALEFFKQIFSFLSFWSNFYQVFLKWFHHIVIQWKKTFNGIFLHNITPCKIICRNFSFIAQLSMTASTFLSSLISDHGLY